MDVSEVMYRMAIARIARLSPHLKDRHRNGVGQIQAALPGAHRQAQDLRCGQKVQYRRGQATGFGAKQERVARAEGDLVKPAFPVRGKAKQPRRAEAGQAGVKVRVTEHRGKFVVIQAGSAEANVVQLKAKRLDQVQLAAGIGTQANDVASVGRDFGLEQDDMAHRAV